MLIEWRVHNELYFVTREVRLAHVDFDYNQEGWSRLDFYIYAAQEKLK